MGYNFYLPCGQEDFVMATIEDDGEMVFDNQNITDEIEDIIIATEMGFEPPSDDEMNLCVHSYFEWHRDPEYFVCKSGAIPVVDSGFVACYWVMEAANGIYSGDESSSEYMLITRAVKRARGYLLGRPIHYRRILDDRRALSEILYSYREYTYGQVRASNKAEAIRAALSLLQGIVNIEDQKSTIGAVLNINDFHDTSLHLGAALELYMRLDHEDVLNIMFGTTVTALNDLQIIKDKKR